MALILLYIATSARPVEASDSEAATPTASGTPSFQPGNPGIASSIEEQGEIKSVIQAYFEIRYRAFNTLQLDGFGDLISSTPEAKAFLDAELGKLEVEIRHAELNHLRYADYEFFLDFKDIAVDDWEQTASVNVVMRHDVVYEISVDLDPQNPIVSHLYDLEHTIILHHEQGQWKIVSDEYADYLWRILRQTGISTDEMLHSMTASPLPVLRSASVQAAFSCNLPADDSTHMYNRQRAVDYALAHIRLADYNPNYPDYNGDPANPWGDCTNFVSQALYEGGNVSMAYCDPNGPYCARGDDGNIGWFFEDADFRASAWTHVGKFYEFVLDPIAEQQYGWTEGPEGCKVNIDQLALGDVIQYDWEGDEVWDHSVFVVDIVGGIPYVASHSPDTGPVPYTGPDYFGTFGDIRFIHIERSDGYGISPTSTPSPEPTSTPTPTIAPTATSTIPTGLKGFYPNGIMASYYNDSYAPWQTGGPITWQTFTTFVTSRLESSINFDTGTSSPAPGVHGTFWSARWDGELIVPQNGDYVFYLNFDDAARLYVDDILYIDRWRVSPGSSQSPPIYLDASQLHHFVVEYAQGPGWGARLHVYWSSPYFSKQIITTAGGSAPTPTPLSFPTSTPTPIPCNCYWDCKSASQVSSPKFASLTDRIGFMVKNLDRIADQAALLYRIRDELLSTTDEGQHYINVYYAHSPGIAAIMDAHLDLAEQGLDVIDLLVPNLQALLDGNGGTMTITEDQIQQAQAFLDALAPYASPELQDAILAEEQRRPLAAMQDLTMEAAWAYLNGYTVNWLSPLDTSDPYIAQAGSTIPVQFTLLDMENNFVVDSSVQLQLLDDGGNVVLGPIGLGNNPDQGIAVQGQKYHYNLKTKGLDAGTYELQILYNSAAPGTPASRTILIKKR